MVWKVGEGDRSVEREGFPGADRAGAFRARFGVRSSEFGVLSSDFRLLSSVFSPCGPLAGAGAPKSTLFHGYDGA